LQQLCDDGRDVIISHRAHRMTPARARTGTIRKQRGSEEAHADGDDGHESVRAEVRCKVSKEKSGSLKCRRGGEGAVDDADVDQDANLPTEPQPSRPEQQPVYSWRGVVDAARMAAAAAHA
jgi:hypothetical protein